MSEGKGFERDREGVFFLFDFGFGFCSTFSPVFSFPLFLPMQIKQRRFRRARCNLPLNSAT